VRALRWHGRGDVRLDEVPDPTPPGPDEVTVQVAYCGICGSDVHEYLHGPAQVPVDRPHPTTGARAPVTLGHEVSGHLVEVGDRVEGLAVGDLVALNALLPCGRCDQCARGAVQRCSALGHIGMSADGGLADLVTVPAAMVAPVDPAVGPRLAALAEPFAVAVHVADAAPAPLPEVVGIVGAGSIGLACGIVARSRGCRVVVVDVDPVRLDHARSLGFETPAAGTRCEVVLDCSGSASGPAAALALTAPGGTVVCAGLPAEPAALDVSALVLREQRLVGAVGHTVRDLRVALDLLAEHRDLAETLITGCVPLEQAVTHGLDVLAGGDRGRHCKILVQVR
jgi:(R,R)-butanediol dehydrogenase/meso-butanediol dehydrogenase/diacetyl reductase